jgi:hypothetical protein
VTSIEGLVTNSVIVASSSVFPSVSSPSSEVSVTLFEFPGEEIVAKTVFLTPAASIANCSIM